MEIPSAPFSTGSLYRLHVLDSWITLGFRAHMHGGIAESCLGDRCSRPKLLFRKLSSRRRWCNSLDRVLSQYSIVTSDSFASQQMRLFAQYLQVKSPSSSLLSCTRATMRPSEQVITLWRFFTSVNGTAVIIKFFHVSVLTNMRKWRIQSISICVCAPRADSTVLVRATAWYRYL